MFSAKVWGASKCKQKMVSVQPTKITFLYYVYIPKWSNHLALNKFLSRDSTQLAILSRHSMFCHHKWRTSSTTIKGKDTCKGVVWGQLTLLEKKLYYKFIKQNYIITPIKKIHYFDPTEKKLHYYPIIIYNFMILIPLN